MAGSPVRVVVAEDDAGLAELIAGTLDTDGRFLVVGCVGNAEDAVHLVEREAPDVVLMDIGLPGRDGIAATEQIRARDAGQHVVIYTGSDRYEDVSRADAAGAVGFLHKDALTSPDLPEALYVLHANFLARVADPDRSTT